MVKTLYIPKQGDIILVNFNPQIGHEQKGLRPGLVVSNNIFNDFTKMIMVCPITNTKKAFPLHVNLEKQKTTGTVMCEQVKSIDFITRKIKFIEKVNSETLDEVIDIIQGSIE